jgi:lysophospholipase L1-like esterase
MTKKPVFYFVLISFLFAGFSSFCQEPPFWNDIQAFKKKDSAFSPPKKSILFVGSSSFTKWTDVKEYFPGYPILNRGFGGSSLPDLIRYANDIIIPYDPKEVVIYCGENDLAASDTVTGYTVAERFKTLYKIIREKYPKIPIVFVSMKPSPSRAHLMSKISQGNELIKSFLAKDKNSGFVDVYHLMLNSDGTPMKDLFVQDMLHMNPKGYAIWQIAIRPYLLNK